MDKFRNLRPDEIECRIGQMNSKGCTLLLYKDARVDQNILDESNAIWQRRHYEVKGNLFCEVSIWNEDIKQWVAKSDCGTESNTEKEKGEASDSFKRACFNWGIGRELYTSPFIQIVKETRKISGSNKYEFADDSDKYSKYKVKEIEITDKEITKLVIYEGRSEVFRYPKEYSKPTATKKEPVQNQIIEEVDVDFNDNKTPIDRASIITKILNNSKGKYVKEDVRIICQQEFNSKLVNDLNDVEFRVLLEKLS